MNATPPPTLQYAPAPRWHRRRAWRRSLAALAVVALSFAAYQWGPRAGRQGQLLYWQHQCMNYAAPEDQVIVEVDPGAAQALVRADPAYRSVDAMEVLDYAKALREPPRCWRGFQDGVYGPIDPSDIVSQWLRSGDEAPVLFLHGRRAANGSRLVAVRWSNPGWMPYSPVQHLDVEVWEPASLTAPPRRLVPTPPTLIVLGFPDGGLPFRRYRFFAGQADPSDPAHFTIDYELNRSLGTIDGWLRDDDTVRVRVRGTPEEKIYR